RGCARLLGPGAGESRRSEVVRLGAVLYVPEVGAGPRRDAALRAVEHRRAERRELRRDAVHAALANSRVGSTVPACAKARSASSRSSWGAWPRDQTTNLASAPNSTARARSESLFFM